MKGESKTGPAPAIAMYLISRVRGSKGGKNVEAKEGGAEGNIDTTMNWLCGRHRSAEGR